MKQSSRSNPSNEINAKSNNHRKKVAIQGWGRHKFQEVEHDDTIANSISYVERCEKKKNERGSQKICPKQIQKKKNTQLLLLQGPKHPRCTLSHKNLQLSVDKAKSLPTRLSSIKKKLSIAGLSFEVSPAGEPMVYTKESVYFSDMGNIAPRQDF